MSYTIRKRGTPNTADHKIYIEQNGKLVSPFHDIPLFPNPNDKTILNMIVEIPRWTNAKLEISKTDKLNPIKQDEKDKKPRFVRNCFPHKGYLWNYGAFPQTWEDPAHFHQDTQAYGDNDPLDVCEIGEYVGYPGQVKQVKVLGIMALLDEGETDWKVIVVDVNDPMASSLNNIEDVEKRLPGLIRATNEWFRIYKIPDKKPENQFAFTGESKNTEYANNIIDECHEAWKRLIAGTSKAREDKSGAGTGARAADKIEITNTLLVGRNGYVEQPPQVGPHEEIPPAVIDSSIDKWFFISGNSN